MKVLIAGATGDVGSETAKIAVEKGHHVRALVRNTSNRDKLGKAKNTIEFYEGDILDKASLEPAMEGTNALIISIRLTPAEVKRGRAYKDVELEGVKNLVEIAIQKGIKKIIHVSALGVGPHCLSDMYQAKYQAEEVIIHSGIDYTIFQPSGMFKDFQKSHIPRVLKKGEATRWPYSPITLKMSPLSHGDLAKCVVDTLTNPAASNKRISIGGPDTITQGDLLNMIAKEAGINAHYTESISKEQLMEKVKSDPENSFFTPEQLKDFLADSEVDHAAIKEIFGIEFLRVEDFIKETIPKVKAELAKHTHKGT